MSYPQKPTPHKTCAHCGRRMQRKRYGHTLETLAKFNGRSYCGPWCAKQAQSSDPEPLPLAALRPRKASRRSNAKLSPEQIRIYYALHIEKGVSIQRLARAGWKIWGFSSFATAESGLRKAFKLEGFKARDRIEAIRLASVGTCPGCGIDRDDRTAGCEACVRRHYKRKRRGSPYKAGRTGCASCGCPLNRRTPGCHTCAARHWERKQVAA